MAAESKMQTDESPALICVQRQRGAALLDISTDSFLRYVEPEVSVIRRGRLRLFLVSDLKTWAEGSARRTLDVDGR